MQPEGVYSDDSDTDDDSGDSPHTQTSVFCLGDVASIGGLFPLAG